MDQIKIWEYAKCRTFYARDNVCNFIKWSKEFGVNQSVLFESDDLVLHANPRQVVLCLLDVARIAYVKYNFTEAPGLVKFEQEINRELESEMAAARGKLHANEPLASDRFSKQQQSGNDLSAAAASAANLKPTARTRGSRETPIGDATDALIMRYCKHKEEEAARKKNEDLKAEEMRLQTEKEELALTLAAAAAAQATAEAEAKEAAEKETASKLITSTTNDSTFNSSGELPVGDEASQAMPLILTDPNNVAAAAVDLEADSLMTCVDKECEDPVISSTTTTTRDNHRTPNLTLNCLVDSLDSGEGNTESVSTSQSQTPNSLLRKHSAASIIPRLTRDSKFSSPTLTSHRASSAITATSELSSSRSSLLSGHDGGLNSNSTPIAKQRQITSDLDGKVMRIAKSYYGKGVTKGVTRLSEGKYKIADRIVFVRLLKGHRVMVRIGGGWDTLENFLFRHKSDPSQVIDVDNLLPLETKMTFEKSPQLTPTNNNNKSSKLPYYRRSNSASATNLSMSNLSTSSPIRSSRYHLCNADGKNV